MADSQDDEGDTGPRIDRLDYCRDDPARPLAHAHTSLQTRNISSTGSVFERAAEALALRESAARRKSLARYSGLVWAVTTCLCAGSLSTFSLYGHILQRRLGYSQYQVNGLSITGEIALYLPVPLSGYLCDRYGPAYPSVGAGVLSGAGYLIAALAYKNHWSYGFMVLGFVLAGVAASAMYLSAVTCCVKNFGKGSSKGLTLALPIAAMGLSGMWLSQFASLALKDRSPGSRPGDIDVFRYFCFLAAILFTGGIVGGFLLRVVDEEELIDEAVEDLATSGILDDNPFFRARSRVNSRRNSHNDLRNGYGTMLPDQDESELDMPAKKRMLLGEETHLFLSDKTMWFLLIGFFFITGPGEAYINNVGTLLGTLSPPAHTLFSSTSPATHVSIIAIASTFSRIASGSLCDFLAPTPLAQNMSSSFGALSTTPSRGISRVTFLLLSSTITLLAQVLTASGIFSNHAEDFWVVSALLGLGYGATFSLTPMIISVVWGIENFGTNWGIVAVAPAGAATVWGLVYSAVYQAGVDVSRSGAKVDGSGEAGLCHGVGCYQATFWAMSASTLLACLFWLLAWRGPGGWRRRGIEL